MNEPAAIEWTEVHEAVYQNETALLGEISRSARSRLRHSIMAGRVQKRNVDRPKTKSSELKRAQLIIQASATRIAAKFKRSNSKIKNPSRLPKA